MKVLFICNQSIDRSPTAEEIFGLKHETKSAGIYSEAKPVTSELLEWAELVFVIEQHQRKWISERFPKEYLKKKILCLEIPDVYGRGQEELKKELIKKVKI